MGQQGIFNIWQRVKGRERVNFKNSIINKITQGKHTSTHIHTHICEFSLSVCVCLFTPFNPFKSDSTATLVGYVNTLIIQMPQTEIESATIETPYALSPTHAATECHCFLCPSTHTPAPDSSCLPLLQGSLAIINSTPCRKLKAKTSSCK